MQAIRHLYWRAGFGLSPQEWEQKRNWPVRRAVDELFSQTKDPKLLPLPDAVEAGDLSMLSREKLLEIRRNQGQMVAQQAAAWISRMADPLESALLERMTLFWHGHFACDIDNARLSVQYLNDLRAHALGNFKDLVLAIARTPAMIRYLNNQQNRKGSPNENFARELLELFTIGRGNYTEHDIKEAARAFTGWSSTLQGTFIFRPGQHDYGRKIFFGKEGPFDGTDIIDLILERQAAAQFIVRKIYRYFVNERIDEKRVEQLSSEFFESGYDIGRLMRRIFESDWFYKEEHAGVKIKSPVEYLAGLMRSTGLTFESHQGPTFIQRSLGQVLFHPPNVAGWPGGKSWVDNSTLMLRLNLPNLLISGEETDFRPKDDLTAAERGQAVRRLAAQTDLQPLAKMVGKKQVHEALEQLHDYLFATPAGERIYLVKDFLQTSEANQYLRPLLVRLMSIPEYQMC